MSSRDAVLLRAVNAEPGLLLHFDEARKDRCALILYAAGCLQIAGDFVALSPGPVSLKVLARHAMELTDTPPDHTTPDHIEEVSDLMRSLLLQAGNPHLTVIGPASNPAANYVFDPDRPDTAPVIWTPGRKSALLRDALNVDRVG